MPMAIQKIMPSVPRRAGTGLDISGAVVLFAAIVLQVVLGIATLLWRVPLPLALLHQAMAMLVLTVATMHAAALAERLPRAIAAPVAP